MSSAQGLLNSVFSCSSPASKAITKRRLRQTRSLDPAIIRDCDTGTDGVSGAPFYGVSAADAGASSERLAAKSTLRTRLPKLKQPIAPSFSSPSIPLEVSPSSNFHFDYDFVKRAKRNTAGDLPFLVRGPGATPSGSTGTLFSPRRWLQRKAQPSISNAYVVWKSEVTLVVFGFQRSAWVSSSVVFISGWHSCFARAGPVLRYIYCHPANNHLFLSHQIHQYCGAILKCCISKNK